MAKLTKLEDEDRGEIESNPNLRHRLAVELLDYALEWGIINDGDHEELLEAANARRAVLVGARAVQQQNLISGGLAKLQQQLRDDETKSAE